MLAKIAAAKEKIGKEESRFDRYLLHEGTANLVNLVVYGILFFFYITKADSVRPDLLRLAYHVLQKRLEFVAECQKSNAASKMTLLPTQSTLRHPLNRIFIQDIDNYRERLSALQKSYQEHFTLVSIKQGKDESCLEQLAYALQDEAFIAKEYVQRKTITPQETEIRAAEIKALILDFKGRVENFNFDIMNQHLLIQICDRGLEQITSLAEGQPKPSSWARVVNFFSSQKAQRECAAKAMGEVMTMIRKYNDLQSTHEDPYPTLTCDVVPKTKAVPTGVSSQQTSQQLDECKDESNSSSFSNQKKPKQKRAADISLPLLRNRQEGEEKRPSRGYGAL